MSGRSGSLRLERDIAKAFLDTDSGQPLAVLLRHHPEVIAAVGEETLRLIAARHADCAWTNGWSAVSIRHGWALMVIHRSRGAEMIEKLKRVALVMCAASGLILAVPEAALASPTSTFAHWSSAGPGGASGSLLGASMSLSGPMGTAFYLHDDYPNFNSSAFTPALAATGMVEIRGGAGHAFTLTFGAPVQNPVIDLGSFGSVMTFPSGTVVTRLSGDSGLHVGGNVVTNSAAPVDVNGTIQLSGAYTTITFTLTYPGTDGIFFQVGGTR